VFASFKNQQSSIPRPFKPSCGPPSPKDAYRPVPRVDLVWTGPEAIVSTARDTLVVGRELFENARERVLNGGYAFDHGEEHLRPAS